VSRAVFDISLIVATYNRRHSLARLLKSIDCLEYSNSVILEVLVVDNGSNDGTQSLLLEKQQRTLKYSLKILREERPGKSAALNCGLRNCRGEIICVVDDDVVLDSQWLLGLTRAYKVSDFDALQGRVLPGVDPFGHSADLSKLHYYNIPVVDHGEQMRPIRGLTGANMMFRRSVFERVGFFDIRLGPGASGFSEDTEFSQRIRTAGFKIGYTPYPVVFHALDPARYGRRYNRTVHYQKGASRSIYRRVSLLRVFPETVAHCLRLCAYSVLRNGAKVHKTEGRVMRGLGYLQGSLWRYRKEIRAREWPEFNHHFFDDRKNQEREIRPLDD
jgi:glycosyltransferase involved in cell wall biosynthesis